MVVTFFRGHPSNDLLPSRHVAVAAQNVLLNSRETDADETTRHPLTYGSDEGALEVRRALASWSNRRFGGSASTDNLNLTNGASYGAASALVQCCPRDYTEAVFVVSPTYFLINSVLMDAGLTSKLHAVVEDPMKGLDLDGLERELASLGLATRPRTPGKYRAVMYLVPAFSNPGGYTLSLQECQRLLLIARKYDMLLLCDEVYNLLEFEQGSQYKPPPLLVTLDRDTVSADHWGNVIANFSMSKYLGPGLRVGWQEATTPELAYHLSQTGATRSGGTPAQLNTFIVKDMLDSGAADDIIAGLCSVYAERSHVYRKALSDYLPHGTQIAGGHGGYFFWVRLPDGYDVAAITRECRTEHGIVLAPGNHFEVEGDPKGWGQHCFRVSLSYHTSDVAVQAIQIWGQVCEKHYATPSA